MKVSDYIVQFLASQGIRHVFAITGGASIHLIHSIAKMPGIDYVCPQHEQAGAMAADAYARVTNNLGVAISTSGPGATNMLTGACCSFYDSVPVIYITGQVSTFRMKRDTGVRQLGFQETDVVAIFKPVTKYSVLLENLEMIRYELEKACYVAKTGRPGPVLIDIPDNLQREQIEPDQLKGFAPPEQADNTILIEKSWIDDCVNLLRQARRPVIILGWGVRLSGAQDEAIRLIEKLGIPVATTWAVMDMFQSDNPLIAGAFGSHGTRYGNFIIQNADLILSVGARLDVRETGSHSTFAREAKKIVVDIDRSELDKFRLFNMNVDISIQADAGTFLQALDAATDHVEMSDISEWFSTIASWKNRYPVCLPDFYKEERVNPYVFVKALSRIASEDDVIFVDTGCSIAWMLQAFEFKKGQRLFHDFNNTAMGYALPASIGASLALDKKPVICVTGDGSLQMNIQELATIVRHNLPIKIFLINNHGYSMIQQTQDQWLNSEYIASTEEGGLAFPDFVKVAKAYGLKSISISKNKSLDKGIKQTLSGDEPFFCSVEIDKMHRVVPQVRFGRAMEDGEPLLDRQEFFENMIVKIDPASL